MTSQVIDLPSPGRQRRRAWELGPEGGEAIVVGFDVAVFDKVRS